MIDKNTSIAGLDTQSAIQVLELKIDDLNSQNAILSGKVMTLSQQLNQLLLAEDAMNKRVKALENPPKPQLEMPSSSNNKSVDESKAGKISSFLAKLGL